MKKLDNMSFDNVRTRIEELKRLFPEAVQEGRLDYDTLMTLLGDEFDNEHEKYQFTWKGKLDSLKLAQKRSNATLRPDFEESRHWETTGNLYIEGDNLEVLKLLQQGYLRKIKMIYIDPPYNTGNDFVYEDNFSDPIKQYKEITGQGMRAKATLLEIFKRGQRLSDFFKNPEKFIEQTAIILRDCKAQMVMDGIRYERIARAEYSVQEIFDKDELIAYLDYNAVPANEYKSLYDHIVIDNSGVERRFASALNDDPDVKLFFKLPDNFKIDTPLGTYNPDWAVLLNKNGDDRLYFVLETKGSSRQLDLRGQENIKIECGKRHFEALGTVDYEVTDDWKNVKLSC